MVLNVFKCLNLLFYLFFYLFSVADLQNQCTEPGTCHPREGDGSLGTAHGRTREEPQRLHTVGGALEHQMECVVA